LIFHRILHAAILHIGLDCAQFYIPANTAYVTGDGFYRSKDSTNSIKVLKEKARKENNPVLHKRYFFYAPPH